MLMKFRISNMKSASARLFHSLYQFSGHYRSIHISQRNAMGKLIKNHLARLIVLTAAACLSISSSPLSGSSKFLVDQAAAAIEGFFWPKIFWDFSTKSLNGAVKPWPILQTINLVLGLFVLAWEWPLGLLAGTIIQRSIIARLFTLPFTALAAVLLYQATNPAIYYIVGIGVYLWAYNSGEVSKICLVQQSMRLKYIGVDRGPMVLASESSERYTTWRNENLLTTACSTCSGLAWPGA